MDTAKEVLVVSAGKRAEDLLKKTAKLEADVARISSAIGTATEAGERVALALGGLARAADGLQRAMHDLDVAKEAARLERENGGS